MNRLYRVPALLLLTAMTACLILSLLPQSTLRGWAELIRRAEDMTPERFERYRQVCRAFAAAFALLGMLAWRHRPAVGKFLQGLFPPSRSREGRGFFSGSLIAWLILFVGIGLRLADLQQPLAYDEAYTYISFASRSLPEAIGDYNSINNHLLNTFCVHVTTRLFGPREWAIRLAPFLCGCLLIPAVMLWCREWVGERAALLAGALTAVSPGLITYSVDARGYIYIVLAAILLDASLARLNQDSRPTRWIAAWLCIVLGSYAMPIMIYGIAASLGWYLLLPNPSLIGPAVSFRQKLTSVVVLLTTAAVAVALLYTPAYIFRGWLILNYLISQSVPESEFPTRLATAWRDAWSWWTDGFLPGWLWAILLLVGLWRADRTRAFHLRWWMPLLVVLLLNIIQQVAPPPRLYLHLSPWIFLLAGIGVGGMHDETRGRNRILATWLSLVTLLAGTAVVIQRPVLFHPEDRLGYGSVPEVIERLDREIPKDQTDQHLLLAPLPCDLPSLYYMDRRGFRLKHNEQPRDGQQVWLIARHEEQPLDVLQSGLIRLGDQAEQFDDWQLVEHYEFLDLYRSTWHDQSRPPENHP